MNTPGKLHMGSCAVAAGILAALGLPKSAQRGEAAMALVAPLPLVGTSRPALADGRQWASLSERAPFTVRAQVSPNPVSYGAYPTLYASTVVGAVCTARVVYSTGRPPRSFHRTAHTVGRNGVVAWTWHMQSRGTSGTAIVTCVAGGRTQRAAASFSISP
jgi:hypothetical protein